MLIDEIVLRLVKGLPLTKKEHDDNWKAVANAVQSLRDTGGAVIIGDIRLTSDGQDIVFEMSDGTIYGPFPFKIVLDVIGRWQIGLQLRKGGIVFRQGTAYIVADGHTSGNFDADLAAGRLETVVPPIEGGWQLKGEYNPAETYTEGSAVYVVTGGEIRIYTTPMDVAAGVSPPAFPWATDAINVDDRLDAIEAQVGMANSGLAAQTGVIDAVAQVAENSRDRILALEQDAGGKVVWARIEDSQNGNLEDWAEAREAAETALTGRVEDAEERLTALEDAGGGEPTDPVTGLPAGGTTGQILAKASNDDGDAHWINAPSGGGGGGDPDTRTGEEIPVSEGGQSIAEALTELDDKIGVERQRITEMGDRVYELENAVIQVAAVDVVMGDGETVEGAILGLRGDITQIQENPIPASRVASEHFDPALGENDLNYWIYRSGSRLTDLEAAVGAPETGAVDRLSLIEQRIAYGIQGTQYDDIGLLIRGLLSRIETLEQQSAGEV